MQSLVSAFILIDKVSSTCDTFHVKHVLWYFDKALNRIITNNIK